MPKIVKFCFDGASKHLKDITEGFYYYHGS